MTRSIVKMFCVGHFKRVSGRREMKSTRAGNLKNGKTKKLDAKKVDNKEMYALSRGG